MIKLYNSNRRAGSGYSYRGFASQPSSNSISKSDTLAANSNIYDYDYYDEDYDREEEEENFLLKALKYFKALRRKFSSWSCLS